MDNNNSKWIPLKQFIMDEAQKHGLTPNAIRYRIYRGKYPDLTTRSKNSRVIDVKVGKVTIFNVTA